MSHAFLWRLMVVSMAGGLLTLVLGTNAHSDVGALAAAYGWLVIASALFLGVGLAIQERVGRVVARSRSESPGSSSIQGHRVF